MFTDLKADLETPRQRAAGNAVRLNPLPAKNTLLTIIFFSAVAVAILYWIFFPPAASTSTENAAAPGASPAAVTSNAQPAERH